MSDSPVSPFSLAAYPLPQLAAALRSGDLPLARYLDMLERQFAEAEPAVQAFMPEPDRFARLRAQGADLLQRWPTPDSRPALFGLPVGIKDIMRVDGLPTTGGSRLPVDLFAGQESECVSRVKAAGALIAGKTVSTEFAFFGPGPTRNPHNLAHTPGGSSSGSAAGVAAGLCPLALGTQTIGSVIRPAAFCGVVGFKPSHGRVSTAGVIPLSPSLDHIGAFAANVAGVALAASVLADDWRPARPSRRPVLGVPEGPYLAHASEDGLRAFRATLDSLSRQGCQVRSVPAMPDFETMRERHLLIMAAEAAAVHADWYARYHDRYHARTVALIERGQTISPTQLAEALAGREPLRAELLALMDEHGLDLWVAPAAPGPAPLGLESTGDPVMNFPWTYSGLPAVSVPAGAVDGLPLGLQVVGRWRADEQLLAWAETLEAILAPASSQMGTA